MTPPSSRLSATARRPIAKACPLTIGELCRCDGMGRKKVDTYGEEVRARVANATPRTPRRAPPNAAARAATSRNGARRLRVCAPPPRTSCVARGRAYGPFPSALSRAVSARGGLTGHACACRIIYSDPRDR
jgi:hypothetical protein